MRNNMTIYGVYEIYCDKYDVKYVGQSTDVENRIHQHLTSEISSTNKNIRKLLRLQKKGKCMIQTNIPIIIENPEMFSKRELQHYLLCLEHIHVKNCEAKGEKLINIKKTHSDVKRFDEMEDLMNGDYFAKRNEYLNKENEQLKHSINMWSDENNKLRCEILKLNENNEMLENENTKYKQVIEAFKLFKNAMEDV